ncbi:MULTISPECIES: DMT family transporter [Pseudomonas]|uniref:DMT family transporter n=1 Tax=Pseudomonas TaxID=286 RepID=UPI002F26A073
MSFPQSVRGIALCCLAVLLFALLDTLSKYLVLYYEAIMVLWARFLVSGLLLCFWTLPREGWHVLKSNCPVLQLLRALCLLGSGLFFITGTQYLPLGEATAVLFIAPLLVTLWSGWYLGERVTFLQWIANAVGFLGIVIILRPGGGLLTIAMLLPLGAAGCFALYQLITRRIGTQDSVTTSNMISALLGVVCTSALVPAFWTHFPEPIHLAAMITQGMIATLGHLLLTQAYRFTSPVILAPFSYLHILFAGLFGMLFFNHVPGIGALLGMVVIALSGLGALIGQRSARKLEVPDDAVR